MCVVGIRVIVEKNFSLAFLIIYMQRIEKGDGPHVFGSLFSK
jgi:hypothetical protein